MISTPEEQGLDAGLFDELTDPRKREIRIRQMLQMRAGYPDEESDAAYLEALYWGVYPPLLEDIPLVSDPGTAFHYSNLTYSWLAILLQRACGPDLKEFARQLIVLLDELDMVIVTTADPFSGQHDGQSWKHEKATINLVGKFIKSLPSR